MNAAYATAPDLAKMYGVPLGTIYVWAHRDHWHRTKTRRPRRYRMDDAQASYDRRYGDMISEGGTVASR